MSLSMVDEKVYCGYEGEHRPKQRYLGESREFVTLNHERSEGKGEKETECSSQDAKGTKGETGNPNVWMT